MKETNNTTKNLNIINGLVVSSFLVGQVGGLFLSFGYDFGGYIITASMIVFFPSLITSFFANVNYLSSKQPKPLKQKMISIAFLLVSIFMFLLGLYTFITDNNLVI